MRRWKIQLVAGWRRTPISFCLFLLFMITYVIIVIDVLSRCHTTITCVNCLNDNSIFLSALFPHLINSSNSLRPAVHLKGPRKYHEVVIGVPSVKRDVSNYLYITLEHLINKMTEKERKNTLIVVLIGETDLEYVEKVSRETQTLFPQHVASGLIELIAPDQSFYPDFQHMTPTLGDSVKHFQWRTKQNLDTIYLMSYAQTKGKYYLMLEDDVVPSKNYMSEITNFTATTSMKNPNWVYLEFFPEGGIGKLFRTSDLIHVIAYLQIFYQNQPIDWLLLRYGETRACRRKQEWKQCEKIYKPRYKSLFQHVSLVSSLTGKTQLFKVKNFEKITNTDGPTFFPHKNLPLRDLFTTIEEQTNHTLRDAYEGRNFFWGTAPIKGDIVDFWFKKPTNISRYLFRSGNVKHAFDIFKNTVVEAILAKNDSSVPIGKFDEFGLADGSISEDLGPLSAIRLRVNQKHNYWVILSEIELVTLRLRQIKELSTVI